ncbi:response regulator transcription factor [Acetobacter cibinongensis]|nr:response regulator transcription factor [Acetobacter cibinongensis]GAN60861.1 two component transcriptional regulator CtrA [Acetobacter cibinongensis]
MRILFAEDNQALAAKVVPFLNRAGLVTDIATSGQDALDMLRSYSYGLAIIELIMPDMDGYDIISTLRTMKIQTPVIVLSAIDKSHSKIKAFSNGADDYLTKPFDVDELVARIQAILRRSGGFSSPVTQVGNLTMDLNTHTVTVNAQPVHLTGKEFSILELLILRKDIALTKEMFLNHLYGGRDEPDVKIIDVFICKLRKKLQEAGAGNLISTIWGRGYILNDPMNRKNAIPTSPNKPLVTPSSFETNLCHQVAG